MSPRDLSGAVPAVGTVHSGASEGPSVEHSCPVTIIINKRQGETFRGVDRFMAEIAVTITYSFLSIKNK